MGGAEVKALASIASVISGSEALMFDCGRRIEVWNLRGACPCPSARL